MHRRFGSRRPGQSAAPVLRKRRSARTNRPSKEEPPGRQRVLRPRQSAGDQDWATPIRLPCANTTKTLAEFSLCGAANEVRIYLVAGGNFPPSVVVLRLQEPQLSRRSARRQCSIGLPATSNRVPIQVVLSSRSQTM